MSQIEIRRFVEQGPSSQHARRWFRMAGRFVPVLLMTLISGAALGGPGGELDVGFANNGLLRIGDGISGRAVAQAADGKLVVAGTYAGSDGWTNFAVLRLNPTARSTARSVTMASQSSISPDPAMKPSPSRSSPTAKSSSRAGRLERRRPRRRWPWLA